MDMSIKYYSIDLIRKHKLIFEIWNNIINPSLEECLAMIED
jgi:hypothetical protein